MDDVTGTIELSGELLHLKWEHGDVVTEGDAVDQSIADFYTGRHKPVHPTRFFTSVDEAMAWLAEDSVMP